MSAGVPPQPGPSLQVFGLAKRFRDPAGERIDVLEHVDLAARPGAFTVVVGAPGSGRSTLLRCIYRSHQPDRGRAYLCTANGAVDLATAPTASISWARRHHLRFGDGTLAAPDRATAGALLGRVLRRSGTTPSVAERRTETALDRFEVAPDRPLRHLDERDRTAVAFLVATLPPASVLLLDEAFPCDSEAGVEPYLQALAETCQRGTAVVATASQGSPLEGFADAVVLLQQGRAA